LISRFFPKISRKFKFRQNLTIISGTLHEDQYTCFIIFRSVLLRMRNVSYKSCTENQNTHFVFRIFFFRKSCVYEIMWKNIVEWGRPQMAIWRMRIACWIPKATNTLRIRTTYCASVLCYTHVVCPVEPPDQLHQHDISHMSNCTQTSAHFNTSTHVTARPICSVYCL